MVSRQQKQKFYFDKKASGNLSTFPAGDPVMMRFGDTWRSSSFFALSGPLNMNSTCCLKDFHSPTRSALSQLNSGLLDAVSILLFIYVLIWLDMGSVHQDASGLKHVPLLTPCYIFMWANISSRNSHVGRHVLFSNDHPCSSSNISITWVTSLASSP